MKAVFISFYQAFYSELVDILEQLEIRGFTFWDEVQGRGSFTGEPHQGSHAWPTLNSAILAIIPEEKTQTLLNAIHQLDLTAPQQGIRAFVWSIENMSGENETNKL
ncbi:MAG: hypothetical protein LBR51_03100 [Bacteroidales bacterium]|jgi:hypothetical protein|nr:hypothetical protein [Bacteroidales bacterium]